MRTSVETPVIIAGAAAAVQSPAGDPQALARIRKWGGPDLVRRLGESFIREAGRRIDAARAGAEAGDADRLRSAAHALKSSSGQLGACAMQALCTRLEADAEAGQIREARALVAALEAEFDRYREWLASATRAAEWSE